MIPQAANNLELMIAISKDMQKRFKGKCSSAKLHDLSMDFARYIITEWDTLKELINTKK